MIISDSISLQRFFCVSPGQQSGGEWGVDGDKNRYLQEHLISDLLSGAGKEVIGWNHKSINRIQRVNRIRLISTEGTSSAPQRYTYEANIIWSSHNLPFPPPQFIGLTQYSNNLQ